jgi:hypothetical protein
MKYCLITGSPGMSDQACPRISRARDVRPERISVPGLPLARLALFTEGDNQDRVVASVGGARGWKTAQAHGKGGKGPSHGGATWPSSHRPQTE